eukprot:6025058-Amphidinium_carterae.1
MIQTNVKKGFANPEMHSPLRIMRLNTIDGRRAWQVRMVLQRSTQGLALIAAAIIDPNTPTQNASLYILTCFQLTSQSTSSPIISNRSLDTETPSKPQTHAPQAEIPKSTYQSLNCQ